MKFQTLILFTALLSAGCIGVPAGAPDVGDTVRVAWTAFDAETGERLDGGSALTFVVGSGGSGLGYDFERQVIGHLPDETFRFRSEDPSRDFNEQFSRSTLLGRYDPVATEQLSTFQQVAGPVAVGDIVTLGSYTVRVEAIEQNRVTYRYVVDEVQRDDISDVFGSTLLTYIDGDDLVQELEPVPGARFTVLPNSPMQAQFGMPVGSFRTIGGDGDQIVFAYTPVTRTALLGVPLDFEVTITTVVKAAPVPPGDNIGVRNSPQLLADPAKLMPLGMAPAESHDDEDDGHGHTH